MATCSKKRFRLQYRIGLLIISLAGLMTSAHAGGIYKWVDEQGQVHYSQDPQHKSAQEMKIKIPKSTSSSEEASTQEEQTAASQPQGGNAEKDENKAKQEAAEKKQQEAQKKNCQIAMKRLATITAGGRLYEVDEKGERHYWDDSTRQAKQAEAQKDVDQWCGQE